MQACLTNQTNNFTEEDNIRKESLQRINWAKHV